MASGGKWSNPPAELIATDRCFDLRERSLHKSTTRERVAAQYHSLARRACDGSNPSFASLLVVFGDLVVGVIEIRFGEFRQAERGFHFLGGKRQAGKQT